MDATLVDEMGGMWVVESVASMDVTLVDEMDGM